MSTTGERERSQIYSLTRQLCKDAPCKDTGLHCYRVAGDCPLFARLTYLVSVPAMVLGVEASRLKDSTRGGLLGADISNHHLSDA